MDLWKVVAVWGLLFVCILSTVLILAYGMISESQESVARKNTFVQDKSQMILRFWNRSRHCEER